MIHPRCGQSARYDGRHQAWYCGHCRMWITGREEQKQIEADRLKALEPLMLKLPPVKHRRPPEI